MPILVQWKWKEETKSYLVIFHFYDDFSKPNLRLKDRKLLSILDYDRQFLTFPIDTKIGDSIIHKITERSVMTWAPSHRELALLSDLLHYANLIGGLSEKIRRELRYDLEIAVVEEGMVGTEFGLHPEKWDEIDRKFKDPIVFLGIDKVTEGKSTTFCCLELCPEYLDYLKEILKPYL